MSVLASWRDLARAGADEMWSDFADRDPFPASKLGCSFECWGKHGMGSDGRCCASQRF